jgi:hypothetical protein
MGAACSAGFTDASTLTGAAAFAGAGLAGVFALAALAGLVGFLGDGFAGFLATNNPFVLGMRDFTVPPAIESA